MNQLASTVNYCFCTSIEIDMCLISFHWQAEQQQLILAANRDEFLHRKSAPLAQWPEHPEIYAGKDLSAGGTWLGVSAQRRFAALTNVRDMSLNTPKDVASRGQIIVEFLLSSLSAVAFAEQLKTQADNYACFNILLCDGQQLVYFTNYPQAETQLQILTTGCYALSNAQLDSPWPKTLLAKQQITQLISEQIKSDQSDRFEPQLLAQLSRLLNQRQGFPPEQLPNTGVGLAMEKILSNQHIITPSYATRCSTAVVFNQQQCQMMEVTWQQGEEQLEQTLIIDFD